MVRVQDRIIDGAVVTTLTQLKSDTSKVIRNLRRRKGKKHELVILSPYASSQALINSAPLAVRAARLDPAELRVGRVIVDEDPAGGSSSRSVAWLLVASTVRA